MVRAPRPSRQMLLLQRRRRPARAAAAAAAPGAPRARALGRAKTEQQQAWSSLLTLLQPHPRYRFPRPAPRRRAAPRCGRPQCPPLLRGPGAHPQRAPPAALAWRLLEPPLFLPTPELRLLLSPRPAPAPWARQRGPSLWHWRGAARPAPQNPTRWAPRRPVRAVLRRRAHASARCCRLALAPGNQTCRKCSALRLGPAPAPPQQEAHATILLAFPSAFLSSAPPPPLHCWPPRAPAAPVRRRNCCY
jgi:hypothetical protein